MTARVAELAAVAAVSMVMTVVMAAPVLRAPSDRIFGFEAVGRHYDPFTVMEQFGHPVHWTATLQPVTDLPGTLLSKYIGPVASYTVIVLLSFPLTALATYLLARHCAIAPVAAGGAALAVAFSPFHIAQAAYHPHVAQLQWLPIYVLALWRCFDSSTPGRIIALLGASAAVALSNFYGGLMAIAITPVAAGSYWYFKMRTGPAAGRRAAITAGALLLAAAGGALYSFYAATTTFDSSPPSFALGDLSKYAARWSSYFVLPVAHPWRAHLSRSADQALLEQQIDVGWSLAALSAIAVAEWFRRRRTDAGLSMVPVLVAIAVVAAACSLSPTTWIYRVLPMFRAYARFGSVVQLMVALLAAIGVERMWQSNLRVRRLIVAVLVCAAVAEYAVWPPDLWRDVLPTSAHRWIAQQPASTRALDCYPHTQESQSIQWLTGGRVILRPDSVHDCRDPGVVPTLSATGFTYMLVRRQTPEGEWFDRRTMPAGLRVVRTFADAQVLAVPDGLSEIRTVSSDGFYPVEVDADWTWRWMARQASWTVVNSSERFLMASVDVETNAFQASRLLTVAVDGAQVEDVIVEPRRSQQRIGPLPLRPGTHTVTFRAVTEPTMPDLTMHNGDQRAVSIAFGDWRWSIDRGIR